MKPFFLLYERPPICDGSDDRFRCRKLKCVQLDLNSQQYHYGDTPIRTILIVYIIFL